MDTERKKRVEKLNIEVYNRWAPDYDRSFLAKHPQVLDRVVLDILRGHKFTSLLDVGCGTGYFLKLVRDSFPGVKLAGADISPEMLKIAQSRLGKDADLQEADAESLPWPDDTFDVATSTDVVNHLPDPISVLNEIRRVLKPGGRVFIADAWLPAPFRQIANPIFHLLGTGGVKIYGRKETLTQLSEAGFKEASWKRFEVLGQTVTGKK